MEDTKNHEARLESTAARTGATTFQSPSEHSEFVPSPG